MHRHISNLRSECLELTLHRFFQDPNNSSLFIQILEKRSKISLRLLDWLATNYSKSEQTTYMVEGCIFNMYSSYKSQLKGYSKTLFDPFQRKERIKFFMNNRYYTTTVGQLNFFKWAIQNKVIEYANTNYDSIHQNMINSQEKNKTGHRKLLSSHKGYSHKSDSIIMEF